MLSENQVVPENDDFFYNDYLLTLAQALHYDIIEVSDAVRKDVSDEMLFEFIMACVDRAKEHLKRYKIAYPKYLDKLIEDYRNHKEHSLEKKQAMISPRYKINMCVPTKTTRPAGG